MIEKVKPAHPEFGIYAIVSIIDNKIYIGGTTKNFHFRYKGHLSALNAGSHSCRHLQNAFNKYGSDNFVFYPLLVIDNPVNVWLEEQRIWDYYKQIGYKIYNIRPNGKKGYEFTEAHKKMCSERLIAYNKSLKGKKKVSWNTGKGYIKERVCLECGKTFTYNNQNRKKLRCSRECGHKSNSRKLTGIKRTEETKAKMSKAKKGIRPSPQTIKALIKKLKGKPWSKARRDAYNKKRKEMQLWQQNV